MQTEATSPKAPGIVAVAAYALGSFGTGVFSTVPTVLLLYFSTEVLKIPPTLAAIAVFVPKVWAIVWDPYVGAWSDRTQSSWGRRRPFLLVGTIGVVVFFIALFTPPTTEPMESFVWVCVTYFGLATLYSLFAVPYIAIPAQIGPTQQSRARLVAWRMTVAMLGVLAGAGVAPILVDMYGTGRPGYAAMALIIAGACAFAMIWPILMMTGRDKSGAPSAQAGSSFRQIFGSLRNARFRGMVFSYLLQLTAAGIFSAAIPYIVTRSFGRGEGDIGIALLAMLGATTLAVPLWAWIAGKIGERPALIWAAVTFGAGVSMIGALAYLNVPWTIALAAFPLAGIPFAGLQVLPFTIVTHVIHDESASGAAAEGAFTGVWTATEKLGLALGPAAAGIALSVTNNDVAHGLTTFVMIAPLVLALLSTAFFSGSAWARGGLASGAAE
jgi:glycoside/pentoside/hexuronide:cation symporter, GPH family